MMRDQRLLDLAGPPAATFANFHAGPNQPAMNAVRAAVAESGAALYLTGEAGSGRSHLLRAAVAARRQTGGTALFADLTAIDPKWIENCETMMLVALDNLDAWAGQRSTEEALFHALNRMQASATTVIASARRRPAECGFGLPDLVSRLASFSHHRLRLLGDIDLFYALRLQAVAQGVQVGDEVLRWLLGRWPRNLPDLLAALRLLEQAAYAGKRRITTTLARELLGKAITG